MLYRIKGRLFVDGVGLFAVNEIVEANPDDNQEVVFESERRIANDHSCEWETGPDICQLPEDEFMAQVGAPRLPGL